MVLLEGKTAPTSLNSSAVKVYDYMLPYEDKPQNINLCTVENGIISSCYEGDCNELNNAILYTYTLHKQKCSCFIEKVATRRKHRKITSSMNTILRILNSQEPLETQDLDNDKINVVQRRKMAFQMTQTCALLNNVELYTKHDCIDYIGQAELFLNGSRDISLNTLKHIYLEQIRSTT